MFCTNCGKEVANNSNFCVNCGNFINASKMGKIIIRRLGCYTGCLMDMKVFMDGKLVSKISNDNTLELLVNMGEHKLIFDLCMVKNTGAVVNVTDEYPNIYIDVIVDLGFWVNKLKIVNIRSERK